MCCQRKHKIPVFLFLFLIGVAFGAWGMVIPPNGVIDGSVLIFIAQVFVLAASVYGFEVHFDLRQGQFHAGHRNDETGELHQP